MEKKFELTDIIMRYKGRTLHRIKSLKDFGNVKKGDLGGWIESKDNLSQFDNCWVYDEGKVYDCGAVYGNGQVYENGQVYDNGEVYDNGAVFGNGEVFDNGQVYDNGKVFGDGKVFGNGEIYGGGKVFGDGEVGKGFINTKISIPYKKIIQIQCEHRVINALLTKDNEIVFNIGCQNNITKEEFIYRIYNKDGGLEYNSHRQEYLDHIEYMESYLKKHI